MKFIVALLLLSLSWPKLSAQTTSDEESWFRYCIGVKGRFYSESECNTGRRPQFEALGLALKQDLDILEEKGIADESQLRSGVYFDYDLKGTGDFKSNLFNDLVTGASDFKLYYDLRVSEIENDTRIYGDFFDNVGNPSNRVAGLNTIPKFGAEDPCSNSFNWSSNRESYELLLDVIVDDPVPLANETDEEGLSDTRLNPDEDHLTLKVGNFYENSKGTPRLQVAVGIDPDTAQWRTIPYVTVVPNSTIELFYPQIAGGKNTNTYNDWLGKNLMFRVSKTLMNGKESFGSVVTDVRFDPPGPQFFIPHVTRSACDDTMVNIFVHLTDSREGWYNDDGGSLFKWNYAVFNPGYKEGDRPVNSGSCIMEPVFDDSGSVEDVFRVIPNLQDGGVNPFITTGELIFKLQLVDPADESLEFCTREFSIPGKPESVEVSHQDASRPLNGSSYHLLSMVNPYAVLDIIDTYEFADLRKPYVIYKGDEPIQKVAWDLPPSYAELSSPEQYGVYRSFMEDYGLQFLNGTRPNDRSSPFGRYFETRFAIWKTQNKEPFLYEGEHQESERSFNNSIISGGYTKLLSQNKRYLFSFKRNELDTVKRVSFVFQNGNLGFAGAFSVSDDTGDMFYALEDGNLQRVLGGNAQNIDFQDAGTLVVFDYNSGVLITREPGKTLNSHPFYWTTIGHNGTITKKKIADAGKNIKISSDGKSCFFTSIDGLSLYAYDGANLTLLNNDLQISSIVGVDTANKLCLFRSGTTVYSQIYDMAHYYSDFFSLNYFRDWELQFKNDCWNRWIQERYGYRLYGVTPNVRETYELVDKDGCSIPFEVEVRIPELPDLDHEVTTSPTGWCSADGIVTITYEGGGSPTYYAEGDSLCIPGDEISVGGIKYGVEKLVQFLNDEGRTSATYSILLSVPGAVTVEKRDVTCVEQETSNGRIKLTLTPDSSGETSAIFHLTNSSTRKVFSDTIVGSNSLSTFFIDLDAGWYEVEVSVGGCPVYSESIELENRQFSAICTPTSAVAFGGTGALSFEFLNQTGNVSWAGDYPAQLQAVPEPNATFNGISPGIYDGIIAVHTDGYGRTCNFELPEVAIYSPKVSAEVGLVVVRNGEETAVQLSSVITQMNTLASVQAEMQLYKDLELLEQESVIFEDGIYGLNELALMEDGDYKLMFSCDNGSIELAAFSLPLPSLTYEMELSPALCPNADNVLTYNALAGGFGSGSYLLGNDGSRFSEQNNWSFSGFKSTVYLQNNVFDEYLVFGSEVEFTGTLTHIVEEDLFYPERVYAKISRSNVSCNGSNNGQISISNAQNGSGNYEWRLGNSDVWRDTIDVSDPLSAGDYVVYLRDSGNECTEVKIGTVNIEEPPVLEVVAKDSVVPVCADGTGSVSLSVDGGNGFYKFQLLAEDGEVLEEYPPAEQLVEDTLEEVLFTADSTVVFPGLAPGFYTISAIDYNGCDVDATFDLPGYDNPKANQINVDPVVCHDQSNGAIEIVETSGTGQLEFLYLLDMNKVELDTLAFPDHKFEGLSAGTYRLLLQDVNGCLSDTVQRVVQQPLPLQLTVESVDHVVAKGEGSGRIRAKVDGGNNTELMTAKVSRLGLESNELVWDGSLIGGRLERFNKLMAGIYEIEVKDYKDCLVVSDAIEVLEPEEALGIETLEIIDALCKARIGSFSIQGTGGWGAYSYKMATDGGYTSISTFEELSAGSYEVMVEDSLGAKVSSFITINEPDLLMTRVVDQTLPTCDNNGVLEVEISGGSWPYQMSYDYEAEPLEIAFPQIVALDNLSAGDFSLTTIDANGCRSEVRQLLSDVNLLSIIDFEWDYPSAPGSEDGRVKALVQGGNAPFEFEWKRLPAPGAELASEGAELSNVGAGYYEVTVSEAGGCSQSDRFYLSAITDGFLTINELGHETAFAASDGFASLLAGQSILTSVEVFYPGDRFETLTGDSPSIIEGAVLLNDLPGGKYLVRATGPVGMEVAEFEIETYKAFAFGVVSVSDVRERGLSDGSVSIAVVGGAPDFVFEWEAVDGDLSVASYSSNANIGIAEGLSAGSYSVRVTDRYGNEIDRIVEVQQPPAALELEVADTRNQSCNSYEDAWVQVSATGGWGDYQFRHAHADEFENPRRWNNLPVGEHKFFTIDQKGIVDSVSITITEPDLLRANVALIDSVACFGDSNGQVYFELTGGTAPYRFALLEKDLFWLDRTAELTTDEGERTFYLDKDLAEGQFVYRFADANNCLAADTLSVYIPQPDELLFSLTEVVHTTCNTDNGSIEVALQGGTLPYRYEWTDDSGSVFSTDASVDQLKQNGFYQLKVWDKHNCQQQWEHGILPSTLPVITSVATEAVLCYGDSNGMASVAGVTPAEPYAPYDFRWSNSLVGDTATCFQSGRHSVTVHDTNGCETTKYFNIATPDTLGLSLLQLREPHCYGYNDGQIEIRPFGGVGSYRFLWSNGDTASVAKNLAKGTYQLAFTDLNNCLFEQTFAINEPPKEVVDLGDDFTMCPGNSLVIDGRNFAAHEWKKEEALVSDERYLTVASEGEYALRVTNDRGCFAYDTLAVSIGNDALKADFLMSSDAILGDTILIFELSNLPLDSLSWVYPPEVFSNETPMDTDDYILHLKTLDHGMYNVALYAYSGGCFSQQVKQIEVRAGSDIVDEDDFVGYQDPLIKHFVVSPNPNDGRFNVNVELRESADIHLAVFSVSQGVKLEERRRSGLDDYAESFVLANVNTGVYVVVLSAGSERRQIKIVIE